MIFIDVWTLLINAIYAIIHQTTHAVKVGISMIHPENESETTSYEKDYMKYSAEFINDAEVLSHLSNMNIIQLGIPGAGKTTLSEELVHLNKDINYISVGDISRNLEPGSPERDYLDSLFKKGSPVGDPEFFLGLIEDEIDHACNVGRGFILDGIPKKSEEVDPLIRFLSKKNIAIDAVLVCSISPDEALTRLAERGGRFGDPDSMKIFMNRTETYLEAIDDFKSRLTLNGAAILSIDTGSLNIAQSVESLLETVRLEIDKKRA